MDQPQRTVIPIESADDERLALYCKLPDRKLARSGELFIAEGTYVVGRLAASDYAMHSVLLSDNRVAQIAPLVPPGVPVYSAPARLVDSILGFQLHCGVIAVGYRKEPVKLSDVAPRLGQRATVVVLPDIINTQNLGGLLRICAAFGADAVVLGERCCDPFYRQAVRVSMGAVFSLTLVQSRNVAGAMAALKEQWGFELVATVLDDSAEPLAKAGRPARLAVVIGNEAQGLSKEHVAMCDRRVTIPMQLGTDSLNVQVAAGIIMHHFTAM